MVEDSDDEPTIWAAEHFCGEGLELQRLADLAARTGTLVERIASKAHHARSRLWMTLDAQDAVVWDEALSVPAGGSATDHMSPLRARLAQPQSPEQRRVVVLDRDALNECLLLERDKMVVTEVASSGPPRCWSGRLTKPKVVRIDSLLLEAGDATRLTAPPKFKVQPRPPVVTHRSLTPRTAILIDILADVALRPVRHPEFSLNKRPNCRKIGNHVEQQLPLGYKVDRGPNAVRFDKLMGIGLRALDPVETAPSATAAPGKGHEGASKPPDDVDLVIGRLVMLVCEMKPVAVPAKTTRAEALASAILDKLPASLTGRWNATEVCAVLKMAAVLRNGLKQ